MPDAVGFAFPRALMSVIWLSWRESTHNLCILVGFINCLVVTTSGVAIVGIAIANVDRAFTCSLDHDLRF